MSLKSHHLSFLTDLDEKLCSEDNIEQIMNLQPEGLIFENENNAFSPLDHLINNWRGESILSANALIIKKALGDLWADAIDQFNSLEYKNPKTKLSILHELKPYISEEESQQISEIGINAIWTILKDSSHPLFNKIDDFKNIFTYRTVVIYFFKLRFLAHLADQIGTKLTLDNILNSSSFIQQCFPAGSSLYFSSISLQNHPYIWFSPSKYFTQTIRDVTPLFLTINLTELTKIITFSQSKYLNFSEKNYSHALSHKEFGFFLNTLLIYLPKWLRGKGTSPVTTNSKKPINALKTRFTGDYLKAITLAHSLDQEEHISQQWSEVITADINEEQFASAKFFKICHEFQNLTLLTKVAEKQKHDVIPLIAHIMQDKSRAALPQHQGTLFCDAQNNDVFYKRIVLNLTSLPTTNSYYHLLKSVQDEAHILNDQGFIFVLTNQKLFVPSQVDRLKTFFKKIKLEAMCDFSELKGRGEIAKYIYIFSKNRGASDDYTLNSQKHLKGNCPTFNFTGELLHFAQFEIISKTFSSFLEHKDINQTPVLVQKLPQNFHFQYFQDAIIDGRILSAGSTNSVNVTHPSFFDKIIKNGIPLKDAFQIELIADEHKRSDHFLGFQLDVDRNYPYAIIVDYKNPQIINLEIISSDSLPAVKEQLGTVTSFYLKLLPLNHNISIETLRTYFANEIGKQIIQLTVHEKSLTPNKIQKNIENLLIPKFLTQIGSTYNAKVETEKFFNLTHETIVSLSPENLRTLYDSNEKHIISLLEKSPNVTLGKLTELNQTLKKIKIQISENDINQTSIFFNPLIINDISNKSLLTPLLPDNHEVYVEFISSASNHHQVIGEVNFIKNNNDPFLVLNDNNTGNPIVNIHSDSKLLLFLQFFLEHNTNLTFSLFIHQMRVPSIEQLNNAFQNFKQVGYQLNIITLELDKLIKSTFFTQLTKE